MTLEEVTQGAFEAEDVVEDVTTAVDLDDEDLDTESLVSDVREPIIVCSWDSNSYNVNHVTMQVTNDENDLILGDWVMKHGAPDKPDGNEEIKKWLQNNGHPDDTAEEAVVDEDTDCE